MNLILTPLQAFNAMTKFLDDYYNKTKSGNIGSLLGDMSFLEDNSTADEAIWDDWIDAIGSDKPVTALDAYQSMIKFLNYYRENTSAKDIIYLLNRMYLSESNESEDPTMWKLWIQYVTEALNESEGSRYYLKLTK